MCAKHNFENEGEIGLEVRSHSWKVTESESRLVVSNCLQLFAWTIQSLEFSRPEYWPFPSPADLPNPGIEPGSPALQADSLPAELSEKPQYEGKWQRQMWIHCSLIIDQMSLIQARVGG